MWIYFTCEWNIENTSIFVETLPDTPTSVSKKWTFVVKMNLKVV